jgi:hypothetical protein
MQPVALLHGMTRYPAMTTNRTVFAEGIVLDRTISWCCRSIRSNRFCEQSSRIIVTRTNSNRNFFLPLFLNN